MKERSISAEITSEIYPVSMKTLRTALGFLICTAAIARAQLPPDPFGNFMNLDFESAALPFPLPRPGEIAFLDWNRAAPGWSHSDGSDTSIVYYGGRHLGSTQHYLLVDANSPFYPPESQLAGRYSLQFGSGIRSALLPDYTWVNAYISQTGLIPLGTESLLMLATGPFAVYVGGVEIPMLSLGGNQFAGDISGFDGTRAELKIVNTAMNGEWNTTTVDNIGFSPTPVPEPSTFAVLFAALAAVLWFRRAGKRQLPAGTFSSIE